MILLLANARRCGWKVSRNDRDLIWSHQQTKNSRQQQRKKFEEFYGPINGVSEVNKGCFWRCCDKFKAEAFKEAFETCCQGIPGQILKFRLEKVPLCKTFDVIGISMSFLPENIFYSAGSMMIWFLTVSILLPVALSNSEGEKWTWPSSQKDQTVADSRKDIYYENSSDKSGRIRVPTTYYDNRRLSEQEFEKCESFSFRWWWETALLNIQSKLS